MPVIQRRALDTRTGLLRAAREVFTEVGFTNANVADVVTRASSSVGSMYHHFGAKADLYLALHEEYEARQEARWEAAVRLVQVDDDQDPVRGFAVGARAYLLGAWQERELARMFLSGDSPPGFDASPRLKFLDQAPAGQAPISRAQSLVLTTVVGAGARAVTGEGDEAQAVALADEVIAVIERLTTG
jgi:AcrR family transcriptional regulator